VFDLVWFSFLWYSVWVLCFIYIIISNTEFGASSFEMSEI
jgi:hypothetical protein